MDPHRQRDAAVEGSVREQLADSAFGRYAVLLQVAVLSQPFLKVTPNAVIVRTRIWRCLIVAWM